MKNILLIDIGAGPLPVVTPVPVRQSAWFPVLHTAPPLPTPPNVRTTAVADGILVEWDAVPIDGVIYVVWRAPAEAGPYAIVHRTEGLRYLHTDNTGEPSWFRVSIELNGRESPPSLPVEDLPLDVSGAVDAAAAALAAALAAEAAAAQESIDRARDVAGVSGAIEYDPEVETPAGTVIRTDTGIYRATQIVPVETPPPNATYWHPLGTVATLADGQDSQATAIFDLQATSEDLGYEQALMAGALLDVQTELPGKASTQSVSLLQGEVNSIDGRVTANSMAVTQVSAAYGRIGNPNLIPNPTGAAGFSGWSFIGGSQQNVNVRTELYGTTGYMFSTNAAGATIDQGVSQRVAQAIDIFTASVDMDARTVQSGSMYTQLRFYNGAGAEITSANRPTLTATPGSGIGMTRYTASGTAPTGTAQIEVVLRVTGVVNGHVAWRNLKVERGTAASPYSDDRTIAGVATITQSMTANAGPGGAYTQALLMSDVNGKLAGYRHTNDGTESAFDFLAERLSITSADGSFTQLGGMTIRRTAGYMTVEDSSGFGAGNEFTRWRGPNQTNLANCTRANAINYETKDGYTFSRGGFIGGNRVTSGFNPSLAVPATFNTGVFGTGGAPIAVNATYAYSKRDSTSSINGRFTPGGGSTGATIQLWRKIGSGQFELVASQSPVGSMNITSTGDASDFVSWNINGAINYIDNVGGTADRTYELRLTSRTLQAANHNGQGAIVINENSQATGVATIE